MGVLSKIARRKESFHKTKEALSQFKTDVALGRMERQQKANIREAEVLKAKQDLRESQKTAQDIRTAQGPSNVQKFGQGLANVVNKGRQAHAQRQAMAIKVGAPQSSGSKGLQLGGSNVFSIGPGQKTEMPKKPAKRPRVIVEL